MKELQNRAAVAMAAVGQEDLSRFEREGGLEAPAAELIDVPLENGIWRRPRRTTMKPSELQCRIENEQNKMSPLWF